ncbi:basic proline-rich protein-like [Hippopotamus amphibius kiboko]|uniref:basic proline-rich protein-like n=1 Tax=Hippopotamus amphibius kiboko TaxID=575201 RepID=UPI002598F57B|nr:basic proline-rich protein-like [Hippopotamus amphibius kiboko]
MPAGGSQGPELRAQLTLAGPPDSLGPRGEGSLGSGRGVAGLGSDLAPGSQGGEKRGRGSNYHKPEFDPSCWKAIEQARHGNLWKRNQEGLDHGDDEGFQGQLGEDTSPPAGLRRGTPAVSPRPPGSAPPRAPARAPPAPVPTRPPGRAGSGSPLARPRGPGPPPSARPGSATATRRSRRFLPAGRRVTPPPGPPLRPPPSARAGLSRPPAESPPPPPPPRGDPATKPAPRALPTVPHARALPQPDARQKNRAKTYPNCHAKL